ncbi:MAG: ATP synthase F0 subunit B [Desulfobacterales bacterium]|nr:ATP synthase F0 subunit B [Desulfobacterales bacterium]
MKAFIRMGKARYVVSVLVVVSVFLAFGLVWASSDAEGEHGEHAAKGKGKDLALRIMNFTVLAGVLIYLLRKPVAKGLESRRQGIKDQLDDLEGQKQEAGRRLAEYKERLSLLDQEVEKIVAEYIREGETAKAKIIEEAKVAVEKLQEQAKKNIEHEFHKAKQQLKAEMAEEAVTMAEELIKKHINDTDQERLIDEYLTKVVVAQ